MRLLLVLLIACGRGPAPCYPAESDAERSPGDRKCRPNAIASSGVPPSIWHYDSSAYCEPWWFEPAVLCDRGPMLHDGCRWRCIPRREQQ